MIIDSVQAPAYRSVPALHAFVQSLEIEARFYREHVSTAASALVHKAEAAGCRTRGQPFTIIKSEWPGESIISIDVCVPLAGTRAGKRIGAVRFEAYTFAYYHIAGPVDFGAAGHAASALRRAIFEADGIITGDLIACIDGAALCDLGYPVIRAGAG